MICQANECLKVVALECELAVLVCSELGHTVVAMDNLNEDYYSSDIKMEWLNKLHSTEQNSKIEYIHGDVCDRHLLNRTIHGYNIDAVIHLASQESIWDDGAVKQPFHYPLNNIDCFVELLEIIKEEEHRDIHLL